MSLTIERRLRAGAPVHRPGRPFFFILLAVLAAALGARQCEAQSAAPPESQRWERIWAGGLHFFGPVGGALAIGPALRRMENGPDDASRLLFLFLEPGFGGQRASLGYAQTVGHYAGGWSVRASALKLTGEPSRRTLLGVELQAIPLLCVGLRAGAFRASRPIDGHHTIFLADLSLCL